MYRRRFFPQTLFTVLAIVLAAPYLRAADLTWNLPGTNTWTAANWGGTMPTVVDNLSFINPGLDAAYSQNVSLSSSYNDFVVLTINGTLFSPLNASIHIGQRGAVNVDNGAWYASESAYTAGSGGGSSLNIFNSYVVFKSAVMGSNASTTVDAGTWSVSDAIVMNATGASLTIRNGGTVSSANATITERSAATVQGAGSSWTMAGNLTVATGYGTGTLSISDGARVQVGGVTYLGTDQHYSKAYINLSGSAGSRGVLSTNQIIAPGTGYSYGGDRLLTFDGGILQARSNQANFLPNVESTDIANDGGGIFIDSNGYDIGIGISLPGTGGLTKLGTGTLTLSGGGVSAYQGDTIVKNGTLALQRGHSTPSREYIIGERSGDDGTLAITGVAVSNSDTLLGAEAGAAGTLKMNSGSLSSSGSLLVGNGGTGTLTMDGGSVSASIIFFGNNGGTGSGTINAGTLSASGGLLVGRGSLTIKSGGSVSSPGLFQLGLSGGTGSLDLQTGGSLASGTSIIGIGGTGTATVSGGTWTLSNNLLIGVNSGTGTLTVSGGTVNVNAQVIMNSDGVGALSLTDESGISGILSTNEIVKVGSGQASIVFNGGTLRALASDSDFLEGFAPGEVTIGTRGANIDTNGKDIGVSSVMSGSGGLTKTGSGTLSLSGNNSYAGGTTIEGGTLRLDHNKALGDPARLEVNSSTLDLNGRGVTVTSLSGTAGTITSGTTGALVLTINQDTDTTYVGSIRDGSGKVYLTKEGSGRLLLSGSNSYTGDTYISDGELFINGDISRSDLVFVNDGATFGGSGAAGNVHVTDLGILAPGDGFGLLNIKGDLTMDTDSILQIEFGGTGAGLFDQLDVDGMFTAEGAILFLDVSYAAAFGDSFHIFTDALPSFSSFTIETNLGGGLTWDVSQISTTGIVSVVPEPSSAVMFALGLGALLLTTRKKTKAGTK
jgi:fibronectin-binding autotransporter adhesin